MKYNKIVAIALLSLSLMACNANVSNDSSLDNELNTNINETNNETNNDTTNNESSNESSDDSSNEVNDLIYYIPMSKNIDGSLKWGYVSSKNISDILIDYQYDSANYFDEVYGFAIVKKDGEVGIINPVEEILIDYGKYAAIYPGSEDVLFAERSNGQFVILDYKGNEYYETVGDEGVYKDVDGIIQVFGRETYTYFDVLTKSLISLETNDYDLINEKMSFINTPFEMVKDEDDKYTVLKYEMPFIEEAYNSIDYTGEYFIVGNESDEMADFYAPINAFGLLDQDGYPLIDVQYYDIRSLADDYFAVAEFDNYDTDYKQYSTQTYKKAIFNRAEAKTGFDYYIIEHVKNSIFYVFDGATYHFLDVESGQKVMTNLDVEGPFEVTVVGEVIVFNHDTYDGTYKIYANEKEVLKRVTNHYKLANGLVLTKFKAAGINPVFYPLLAFNDSDVENKINNVIDVLFDTVDGVELDSGHYSTIGSIGFEVKEYMNIFELTQTYFWYGLGAAHGNYGNETHNFDLTTGELITISDLFKDDVDIDVLIPMLLKEVALENPDYLEMLYVDLTTISDEEVNAYFKRDSYNFYLSDVGLTIYYNPYDIGPYAAGLITMDIPYEMIDEYLNKDKSWFTN